MNRPQLHALTSIRFFFAMMVLVGHFVGHFPSIVTPQTSFLYNLSIAVSWFFILSGFIIAYNYPVLANATERKNFLIARVARLWPLHALTTLAMIFLQGGGKYYLFFLTMTHTWTASANMSTAYNGPSWSISDEMFFYVAYIGLLAPARWLRALVIVAPISLSITLSTSYGCFLPISDPASGAST